MAASNDAPETDAPERAVLADLAFHRALLFAAHNELLAHMETVIESGLQVRDQLVHGSGQWPDPVPEHREVLDAVHARDPAAARQAMQVLLKES